jgi:hypothetical protein
MDGGDKGREIRFRQVLDFIQQKENALSFVKCRFAHLDEEISEIVFEHARVRTTPYRVNIDSNLDTTGELQGESLQYAKGAPDSITDPTGWVQRQECPAAEPSHRCGKVSGLCDFSLSVDESFGLRNVAERA